MAKSKKPDITLSEVTAFVGSQQTLTAALRTRMETTEGFLRDDWFKMPGPHPENYETMPTAKPIAFKTKLTSELASGLIKRTIPYEGKIPKKTRDAISLTERASYGLTELANDRLIEQQLPTVQEQEADDIPRRGYVAKRIWLYEENIGGENTLVSDIAVWDVLNLYWNKATGKNRKVCYVKYMTEDEARDLYPDAQAVPDKENRKTGQIVLYDWWSAEWEVVFLSGDPDPVYYQWHNKGYVPIYIMPVGANRPRQDSKHDDNLKFVGQDLASAGGAIVWPVLSRIMSYYLTMVKLGTHPTKKIYFDGPENIPIFTNVQKMFEAGALIPLDISKKQEIGEFEKPALPVDAQALFGIADAEEEIATAAKIFWGRSPANITAQGTAMLMQAAMAVMQDYKRAMERADKWEANELIRQFKDGDFKDIKLQGMDGKRKDFAIDVNAVDLVTDRRIKSELLLNTPQDEMQKVDVGAKLKQLGWISDQTGMDKYAGVPDPDSERERMSYERIAEIVGLDYIEAFAEAVNDKNQLAAGLLWAHIQANLNAAKAAAAPQGGPQPGLGPTDISAIGQMKPTMIQPPPHGNTPTPTVSERLGRLGMVRAR